MRSAVSLVVLLALAACSGGPAAATPSPTPVSGPIPAAVDDAFCELTAALPGVAVAIGPLAEALGRGDFDVDLIRRDGPGVRRAIATVRPFLPVIARWAPSHEVATLLDSGLAGVDAGLERLMREPNDLLARANLALAGNDVNRALRDLLPALEAEHPEIRCE